MNKPDNIRHGEPPLGGAAIRGGASGAAALDCFVTSFLAITRVVLTHGHE
jgi:hypothetical protein